MTIFDLLVTYFSTIFNDYETYDYLNNIAYKVGEVYEDGVVTPYYMALSDWLIYTCALISTIIIVILCCLFVYKIIKLIGGLIR